eukprot:SAG31_NODE_787_length_12094_cov_27.048270_13_plen_138_part_00
MLQALALLLLTVPPPTLPSLSPADVTTVDTHAFLLRWPSQVAPSAGVFAFSLTVYERREHGPKATTLPPFETVRCFGLRFGTPTSSMIPILLVSLISIRDDAGPRVARKYHGAWGSGMLRKFQLGAGCRHHLRVAGA